MQFCPGHHLSWIRWNPSWRERLIVFSVVEGDPSNETRVHRSERQKAAGSLTGKMNPTLGHSIGQAFNEWACFEMCWIIAHALTYATLVLGKGSLKKSVPNSNGNCSSLSLSSSLHWLGSLCRLGRTEDRILWTLYSEIMGALIGWSVTEWLVV